MVVRWRWFVASTPSPTSTTTTTAPSGSLITPGRHDAPGTRSEEDGVHHPANDPHKTSPEDQRRPIQLAPSLEAFPDVIIGAMPELLLAFLRQQKPVFDAAAAFEDVWVLCRVVAFADYFGRAEFEFGGAGRRKMQGKSAAQKSKKPKHKGLGG